MRDKHDTIQSLEIHRLDLSTAKEIQQQTFGLLQCRVAFKGLSGEYKRWFIPQLRLNCTGVVFDWFEVGHPELDGIVQLEVVETTEGEVVGPLFGMVSKGK